MNHCWEILFFYNFTLFSHWKVSKNYSSFWRSISYTWNFTWFFLISTKCIIKMRHLFMSHKWGCICIGYQIAHLVHQWLNCFSSFDIKKNKQTNNNTQTVYLLIVHFNSNINYSIQIIRLITFNGHLQRSKKDKKKKKAFFAIPN